MKIKIKTVKHKEKEITVNKSVTVGQIREQVMDEPGFERIKKLVYRGNILDDETITVEKAGIENNDILICVGCESEDKKSESKKLRSLSGLNGDTTYGFNMGEFISEVTKMMEELLKLSDEEIDKLLTNSDIRDVSNIKSTTTHPEGTFNKGGCGIEKKKGKKQRGNIKRRSEEPKREKHRKELKKKHEGWNAR